MKRQSFLGLALGIAIGWLIPTLISSETPDTFWYRVEWSANAGYVIGGGGVGTYDLRDNLRTVGRQTSTLGLTLGNPNVERICRISQSPNRRDCFQRGACDWFIVQYADGRYEILVPRNCPVTEEVQGIGGSLTD